MEKYNTWKQLLCNNWKQLCNLNHLNNISVECNNVEGSIADEVTWINNKPITEEVTNNNPSAIDNEATLTTSNASPAADEIALTTNNASPVADEVTLPNSITSNFTSPIAETYKNKGISIILCGRTGSGKSTLTSSLLGHRIPGPSVQLSATVSMYDSPGLEDSSNQISIIPEIPEMLNRDCFSTQQRMVFSGPQREIQELPCLRLGFTNCIYNIAITKELDLDCDYVVNTGGTELPKHYILDLSPHRDTEDRITILAECPTSKFAFIFTCYNLKLFHCYPPRHVDRKFSLLSCAQPDGLTALLWSTATTLFLGGKDDKIIWWRNVLYILLCADIARLVLVLCLLMLRSGDVETNPGPGKH